uniref:Ig-like domain-containing protein n=1 Tax=Lepisosteus oculatus TaxID=7918 RepID=W5NMG5_LEPOC
QSFPLTKNENSLSLEYSLSLFPCIFLSGGCDGALISQWPECLLRVPSSATELHCYQNNTEHTYMYWYRWQKDGHLVLISVSIEGNKPTYEEGFQSGYEAKRSGSKKLSLTVESVKPEDSAVYLCAAS